MSENTAWPQGVAVITLFVDDLSATKQFYQQVFGLPVIFEDTNSCVIDFKNMLINLLKTNQADELITPAKVASSQAGARFMFTIQVQDVDAICTELKTRSVELLNGPINRPWGVRTASFIDPGGHIWEIASNLT